MPQKYSTLEVFAKDLSDHCIVGAVRNTKISCSKPHIITKRNSKLFSEQASLHNLFSFNWGRITMTDIGNLAWKYFQESFIYFVDKHAPFCQVRPWFNSERAGLLHERNQAWAAARKSRSDDDWLCFCQLRNQFTVFCLHQEAYFLTLTTDSIIDPRRFWQTIKSLPASSHSSELPLHLIIDFIPVSDKTEMLNVFNKHFVTSCSLFSTVPDGKPPAYNSASRSVTNTLFFTPFMVEEVCKALKSCGTKKSAGPDSLCPSSCAWQQIS